MLFMLSERLQWRYVLQVHARTICMMFEGIWTPVVDIVVDKVGKYAYVIGSPMDATGATPVIMDVTLDVRTKVGFWSGSKTLNFSHLLPAWSWPDASDTWPWMTL